MSITSTHSFAGLSRRGMMTGLAIAAALTLAGCGKKGPLEPPPGSDQARSMDKARASAAAEPQVGVPAMRGAKRRPPPVDRPKEEFFLDFLL